MKPTSSSFFNYAFTRSVICGCIFLSFCLTSFEFGNNWKWWKTNLGSNPCISTYDQEKFISLSKKKLINFGFLVVVKDVAKCTILGLSSIPRLISYDFSTRNGDLSWFMGSMSNPPPLGTSRMFSPSNTSFIFTYS